jgi:DNA-binding helix-hairpin-helix protein with protein kinase domain
VSQAGAVISLVDVGGKARKVKLHQELASGGAGIVFSVQGEPGTVVKIYRQETLRQEGSDYEAKIVCMLEHVPALPTVGDFVQIAWPFALANDSAGRFIGFAMPTVDFQKTDLLESMLQPKQAELRNLRSDLGARITVAANLAEVVSAIHKQGHKIVDLKPPNLRFYRKELYVAVLDCDGFDISVPGRSHSAPQATPEYLAPEYHQNAIADPEPQDRFALAVIIFRILNFGIHPYDGLANDKAVPTDREGKVSRGLYPYGIKSISAVSPLPVSAHQTFPSELRQYFDKAFSAQPSMRPSAREWSGALRKYAEIKNALLAPCNAKHLWFTGRPCGECHRDRKLNRTPGAKPGVAFDLMSVWKEIQSITPPSIAKQISPSEYAPTPAPLPDSISSLKRRVRIQRLLVWVLAPLAVWGLELNLFAVLALAIIWYRYPWGRKALQGELGIRESQRQDLQGKYDELKSAWDQQGNEALFQQKYRALEENKIEYENLHEEFRTHLNSVLEQIREERLAEFLENTLIEPGLIDGIGPALIEKLNDQRIFSAANVSRKKIAKISGFGQVREDRLIEWRDDLIDSFSFDPADALAPAEISALKQPFDIRAKAIEYLLLQGSAILKNSKIEILEYRQQALRPLCAAAEVLSQADADLSVIKG